MLQGLPYFLCCFCEIGLRLWVSVWLDGFVGLVEDIEAWRSVTLRHCFTACHHSLQVYSPVETIDRTCYTPFMLFWNYSPLVWPFVCLLPCTTRYVLLSSFSAVRLIKVTPHLMACWRIYYGVREKERRERGREGTGSGREWNREKGTEY